VPQHLFDQDNRDLCLTFNHGTTKREQIQHHYIKPASLYNIFSCPETLMGLLRKYQPEIRMFHQTAPFIETVLASPSLGQARRMAIFFYSPYLDIVVVENSKLLFYNTFKIVAPEDSVFYLTGVSNLFDTNLSSSKLLYMGDLKCMPPEIEMISGYVADIVDCSPSDAFVYSHYITSSLRKKYINLFNLYGCES
jgi:hypothetical protein